MTGYHQLFPCSLYHALFKFRFALVVWLYRNCRSEHYRLSGEGRNPVIFGRTAVGLSQPFRHPVAARQ